jgi:hypothetical protein
VFLGQGYEAQEKSKLGNSTGDVIKSIPTLTVIDQAPYIRA